jgi:hypothetical protein
MKKIPLVLMAALMPWVVVGQGPVPPCPPQGCGTPILVRPWEATVIGALMLAAVFVAVRRGV